MIGTGLNLFTGNAKKPLLIALALTVFALLLTGGYLYAKQQGYDNGYVVAEHYYLQAQQQAVANAIKQTNQDNVRNTEIANRYWQKELAKKPKIQTIEKRIVEYVETTRDSDTCQLDDGELFILQDLVSIANGDATAATRHRPGTTSNLPRDNTTHKEK